MLKVAKTKSGQSADDLYKSNWAYWDRLQFLQPVMKPGKSRDTLDPRNDDLEHEESSSTDLDSQITAHSTPRISKKAYETKKSELLSTCISALKEPVSKPIEKEQCHFSMHIAQKLAQFDRRKRAIVEKRINDIIFELEMSESLPQSTMNHYEGFQYNGNMVIPSNQGPFMTMMQQ